MKDVMLDLETLGKNENKALCQIGAIYFDKVTGELGESFKINVDACSHETYGGKVDADTVYWWLSQSEAARNSILAQPRVPLFTALTALNAFLANATRIWSHATFDFVTIMHAMKQAGIKPNFSFKAGMDLRTLVYLAGKSTSNTVRTGTHHDALADCEHQVKYCVSALNAIKTNKKLITFVNGMTDET